MKKLVKRLTAVCCVAALAVTCAMGAGAGSIEGNVGGVVWYGSTVVMNQTWFQCRTSIGRSASLGDLKRLQAFYTMANGPHQDRVVENRNTQYNQVEYDCIHTPSMSNQNTSHYVNLVGKGGQSGTSYG